MDANKTPATETLTDDMISALRDEAAAAGDQDMVMECDFALDAPSPNATSRFHCAQAINRARAMDESRPFVRVAA